MENKASKINEVDEVLDKIMSLKPSQINYLENILLPEELGIPVEIIIGYKNCCNGEIPKNCPECSNTYIVKNGRNRLKKQRYLCRACGTVFSIPVKSPFSFSKKSIQHWLKYLDCMSKGLSIRESARIVGIHSNTSFHWRHKILNAMKNSFKDNMSGIVEIDEAMIAESFKGNHSKNDNFSMGRRPRKRGMKYSERVSRPRIRVLCCMDRVENIFSEVSGRVRLDWQRIMAMLKDKIEAGSTLVTNNNMAYEAFAKRQNLRIYKLDNYRHAVKEVYHNENARLFGKQLESFLIGFHGVATKYLNYYITWLKWNCLSRMKVSGFKIIDIFLLVAFSKARLRVCDFRLVSSMPPPDYL